MNTHDFGEKPTESNADDAELAQKLGNRGMPANSSGVKDKGNADFASILLNSSYEDIRLSENNDMKCKNETDCTVQ